MNHQPAILIIEDDSALRRGMARILTDAGFQIFEAATGTEGLASIERNMPALILLDVRLPDIEGFALCHRLKTDPAFSGIYILLISGVKTGAASQAEGLENGADGYIVRPIENRELVARVRAMLRLKHAEDELRRMNGELEQRVAARTDELRRLNAQLATQFEEYQQSERKYRAMFEYMSSGVAVYDAIDHGNDFIFHDFNAAAERISNISRDCVIGQRLLSIFPNMEQFGLLAALQRVYHTGESEHLPAMYYQDEIRKEWRENFIYKLPSGEIVTIYDDVTERKHAEMETQTRMRQQAAVADLGQRALSGLSLHELFGEAVALVARILDVEYSAALELLPDRAALRLRAGVGWRDDFVGHAIVSADGDTQAGYTLLSREPVIVEDLRTERRFHDQHLWHDYRVVSGMSVIIGELTQPFGVLSAHTTQQRTFAIHDTYFLQSVANILAAAIDRERHEEILHRQKQEYQTLVEHTPDVIARFDRQYRHLYVNPAVMKEFGRPPEYIIGKTHRELGYSPERADRSEQIIRQVFESSHEIVFELEAPSPTGIKQYLSRGVPEFDAQGTVETALFIHRNITELKQAEVLLRQKTEELDHFFNLALDLLCIADTDGYFRKLNVAWETTLGYSREELFAKKFLDFVHPDDLGTTIETISNLSSQQKVLNFTNRYRCKDGSYRWIEWRSAPAGKMIYAAAHDVTARKLTEHEIQQLNQTLEARVQQRTAELEAMNRDLQNFVSAASHDLKTPLHGISRIATWLVQDYAAAFDEHGRELAEDLIQRVTRLDTLLDGVVEYASLAQPATQIVPIDLNHVLPRVLRELAQPADIQIDFPENLPTILGEARRVRKIFYHLLRNAIQFNSQPGSHIRIAIQEDSAQWTFCITDNGPGIDPKYHAKIFKLFQMLDPRNDAHSTGIGLALVKKIVESAGGRVWVKSEVGKGSSFSFTWPKIGYS